MVIHSADAPLESLDIYICWINSHYCRLLKTEMQKKMAFTSRIAEDANWSETHTVKSTT